MRLNALLEQKLRDGNLKSSCGLSAAYVKTLCCLLRAVLSDAADRGLCAPLPPRALKKPQLRRAEITILTPAQQCTLTAACLAEKNETGLGVFLTLYAGLRMGEVCELLGHANAAVTLNIYVHSSLEQKRAQLERLSAFLHM